MKKILLGMLAPVALLATDYAFVDLDRPWEIACDYPWHFEADGRTVGSATFDNPHKSKGSHLTYSDAHVFGYYSHFLNPNNALSWQLGYTYMRLNWDKPDRFDQKNFHLGVASLAYISTGLDRWRWIVNLGLTVDTTTFDFGHSSVYYGLLWGRYAFRQNFGVHGGLFGITGVHTTYTLPVIGFDWTIAQKWQLNAVFPLDFSLTYHFNNMWSAALFWETFGGPYHYPWRVNGGQGRFRDAIVEVYSKGLELDLNFDFRKNFHAGIGGGYNFGGWLLVRNHEGRHGRYYKFNSAPYAQANLAITF